ncbi:Trafficking protein particle complex subunit 2-like protein [Zea mays]|uniref:Trafficking protein particle complex subunit 2-like protein n=1 Tax=Zea mays TaxID=4577 RepID=A0A3L6G1R4_MAIZE|nr:Trafficking protein particle complex subunit 2-like protein [Zea mays]
MIFCVAVVGHQNNPLYLQSFTEADDALKLHHIVHCSLDVIDETLTILQTCFCCSANFFCLRRIIASTSILLAVNNTQRSAPTLNETFLGLLYPTENYRVYGYLTNTKVKFIMVTTDLNAKDADARNSTGSCSSPFPQFFRKFHAAYVDAVSNPFHVPGKKVASRSFGARVSTIVKSFGSGTTS